MIIFFSATMMIVLDFGVAAASFAFGPSAPGLAMKAPQRPDRAGSVSDGMPVRR